MKNIFALSIFIFSQLIFAQQIQEKSLLWEISGNGLQQNSYLYGTMHLMCRGDVEMTPKIQNAFDKTQTLLLEIDMDDPSMMGKMMQATLANDGKTVTEKLGKELSAKVDTILRKNSPMTLAMVNSLNLPTLSMQIGMFALDCELDLGYDMLFVQEAKAKNKEIIGLESVNSQIQLLLSQPDSEAKQAIEYMVTHFDEVKTEMNKMVTTYKSQDVQKLYDITQKTFSDPKYPQGNLEEFLDKRNIAWIPVIEKSIKQKPIFIAVGAAHLAGNNGVINLLRKAGYAVKAIN